jgi:DNA modification methylase
MDFNQIYNEDCITGMQKLPDNCIDLCVTSPPYNLGVKYDVYNDWMEWSDYYVWCEQWLNEVYRVLKPDGRFCLNHYLSCGTSKTRSAPLLNLNCICNKIGFKHHGISVWDERTLTKYQAWGSWKSASAPYINCLSAHTLVITDYGLVPISEINKTHKVMTSDGKYHRASIQQKKEHIGDLIEITLHHNLAQPITCTKEHRFLVREQTSRSHMKPTHHHEHIYSKPKWVSSAEIQQNAYHNRLHPHKNHIYYTATPKFKNEQIPNHLLNSTLPIDNTVFWEFVGFWLAEGIIDMGYHSNSGCYRIRVSGHQNEETYIKNLFTKCGFKSYIYRSKCAKGVTIAVCKKELWEFLNQFYQKNALKTKGAKSHLKHLPEWCVSLPTIYCKSLLKGYLKGDGHEGLKRKAMLHSIESTSYPLLVQFQRILLKCGYYGTLYPTRKERHNIKIVNGKPCTTRKQYRLAWYDHKTRYKKIYEDNNYIWLPIKSAILKTGQITEVYDLHVPKTHTFCLPGAVTHNSPYECILITYKDHWKKDRKGETEITPKEFMESCSGIWKMQPVSKTKRKTIANFPLELPMRCIKLLSYKNDVVLDPFMGGGTTAYAAKMLDRQYIGFELSEDYWKKSLEWVAQCKLDTGGK